MDQDIQTGGGTWPDGTTPTVSNPGRGSPGGPGALLMQPPGVRGPALARHQPQLTSRALPAIVVPTHVKAHITVMESNLHIGPPSIGYSAAPLATNITSSGAQLSGAPNIQLPSPSAMLEQHENRHEQETQEEMEPTETMSQDIQDELAEVARSAEAEENLSRLVAFLGLVALIERSILPVLEVAGWNGAKAVAGHNQDTAERRGYFIEQQHQADRLGVQARLQQRHFLGMKELARLVTAFLPVEGYSHIPTEERIINEGIEGRFPCTPTRMEQIDMLCTFRKVTGMTSSMLRLLLEYCDWDVVTAEWAYHHGPNRADMEGVAYGESYVALPEDQNNLNAMGTMLFKLIENMSGPGGLEDSKFDIDTALFILRKCDWDLEQAEAQYKRLEKEFCGLCDDLVVEVNQLPGYPCPNARTNDNPLGLRLIQALPGHGGKEKPTFPVQDWWSPDVEWDWIKAKVGKPNESYLWYLKATRGGTKWFSYPVRKVNWDVQYEVSQLDKWRRQPRMRMGSEKQRPRSIPYVQPENDAIIEHYKKCNAALKPRQAKRDINMKQFVLDFNTMFEGKVIVGFEGLGPRPPRTRGSIQSQAGRLSELSGILTIHSRNEERRSGAGVQLDSGQEGEGSEEEGGEMEGEDSEGGTVVAGPGSGLKRPNSRGNSGAGVGSSHKKRRVIRGEEGDDVMDAEPTDTDNLLMNYFPPPDTDNDDVGHGGKGKGRANSV